MTAQSLDLAAIQARAAEATPGGIGFGGTWGTDLIGDERFITAQAWDLAVMASRPPELGGSEEQRRADALFIAHAREDIPALVAEVERLRGLIPGIGTGPDGTSPVTYYEVRCATCGASAQEGTDVSAWLQPFAAVEDAEGADWKRDEQGRWQCDDHRETSDE